MRILLFTLLILTSLLACKTNTNSNHDANHAETTAPKARIQNIKAEELTEFATNEDVIIMDVRTSEEYAQGFVQGTKQFIDFQSPSFETQIDVLDKEKTYVVYCRSGNRSSKALNIMRDKGFQNLYELVGGIKATPANMITLKK